MSRKEELSILIPECRKEIFRIAYSMSNTYKIPIKDLSKEIINLKKITTTLENYISEYNSL